MLALVHAMEISLRTWEDACLQKRLNYQLQRKWDIKPAYDCTGPFEHFEKFRKHLLRPEGAFDESRFIESCAPEVAQLRANVTLPLEIFQWARNSRRVFHVTAEVSELLRRTSVEGLKWKEIHFPFDSFAMTLEKPLVDDVGRVFTGIHFTMCLWRGKKTFLRRLWPRELEAYQALSAVQRQRLKDLLETNPKKLSDEVFRLNKLVARIPSMLAAYIVEEVDDATIEETATDLRVAPMRGNCLRTAADGTREVIYEDLDEGHILEKSFMLNVDRLAIGLAMYLQTLPSRSPHQSEWRPTPRMSLVDGKAITDEAQICTVSCSHRLTREERVYLGIEGERQERTACELRAHFRRGHWRRPPGYGHLPEAPKIVWVRPTLVRRDRVAPGSLPGGSETQL